MDPIDRLYDYISALWTTAVDRPFPPIPRRPRGDGTVYVEWRKGSYWLVCEERGEEYWRRKAQDMDDAAFELISIEASDYIRRKELALRESKPSLSDGYSRWNWMCQEIELMQTIKAAYGARTRADYIDVLRYAPLSREEIDAARYPIPPSFT